MRRSLIRFSHTDGLKQALAQLASAGEITARVSDAVRYSLDGYGACARYCVRGWYDLVECITRFCEMSRMLNEATHPRFYPTRGQLQDLSWSVPTPPPTPFSVEDLASFDWTGWGAEDVSLI